MPKAPPPLRTIAVVLPLLAAGCGRTKAGPGAGGGFEMPPTVVETATAERRTVRDTLSALGTVEPREAVAIVSEIDGKVKSLPFAEGQPLKRGDLVAELDDDQLRAELARAEAVRDQQHATFARVQRIVATKVAPPQDLDDAAAAMKVAEAELLVARTRVQKTHIVAPFDGITGPRKVSPGAFLRPGDPITDLAASDVVKVTFSAPERYLSALQAGAKVRVATAVFPQDAVEGTVVLVGPSVDPTTRTVRVVAHVANADRRLRPGMSADVSVVLHERPDAIAVPAEAVFAEGKELLVYVVKEGTVARTAVTIGMRLPDVVEITSGLDAGAVVVRAGHQKLFPGAKVVPAEGGPPAAAAADAKAGEETAAAAGK